MRKTAAMSPIQTFMRSAANDYFEPIPEVLSFLCERSQRENLLYSREITAASQREMRSFRQCSENLRP